MDKSLIFLITHQVHMANHRVNNHQYVTSKFQNLDIHIEYLNFLFKMTQIIQNTSEKKLQKPLFIVLYNI